MGRPTPYASPVTYAASGRRHPGHEMERFLHGFGKQVVAAYLEVGAPVAHPSPAVASRPPQGEHHDLP